MRSEEFGRGSPRVRPERPVDLVGELAETERLASQLRQEMLVLAPGGDQDLPGRAHGVIGDPAGVGRVAADREQLLLQERRRLEGDAVEPDRKHATLPRHDPHPLGVAVRRLEVAGGLAEVRPLEDPRGEAVPVRRAGHAGAETPVPQKPEDRIPTGTVFPAGGRRGEGDDVSARPTIVALDGPSGAGKSTVVARVAHTEGWVPLAEAYDRLEPPPALTYSTERELHGIERTLLSAEGERYRAALEIRESGRTVVADTGFAGPLTYTAGLVRLGLASRATLAALVRQARGMSVRGSWGMADATVYLVVAAPLRRGRARSDPIRHPPALVPRHEAVGRAERALFRTRLRTALPGRIRFLRGRGSPTEVARRVALAVRPISPDPAPRAAAERTLRGVL